MPLKIVRVRQRALERVVLRVKPRGERREIGVEHFEAAADRAPASRLGAAHDVNATPAASSPPR